MSKQKTKKQPEKKGEVVKLTNGMIDGFQRNESIRKLRRQCLTIVQRQELYKLSRTIIDSAEAKALQDHLQDMEAEHKKSQEILLQKAENKDKKAQIMPLLNNDPKVLALFSLESGLEVRKICIPMKLLSTDFTADDMLVTDWIIQFEE